MFAKFRLAEMWNRVIFETESALVPVPLEGQLEEVHSHVERM